MIWFPYTLIHLDMNFVLTAATHVLKLSSLCSLLILSIYCIQFCRTGSSRGCSALWAVTHNYAHTTVRVVCPVLGNPIGLPTEPVDYNEVCGVSVLTKNKTLYVTELLTKAARVVWTLSHIRQLNGNDQEITNLIQKP